MAPSSFNTSPVSATLSIAPSTTSTSKNSRSTSLHQKTNGHFLSARPSKEQILQHRVSREHIHATRPSEEHVLAGASPILRTNSLAPRGLRTTKDQGIITLRYEDSTAARPPIPVTVPPPRQPPTDIHPALRRPKSGVNSEEGKRDSGLAATTSSRARSTRGDAREGSAREGSFVTMEENPALKIDFDAGNIPSVAPKSPTEEPHTSNLVETGSAGSVGGSRWRRVGSRKSSKSAPKSPVAASVSSEDYVTIETPIPTESFLDENFLDSIEFSKRGSMLLGGRKAVASQARPNAVARQPSFSALASASTKLPDDVEGQSKKVRSMYENGTALGWMNGEQPEMPTRSNETSNTNGHLAPQLDDVLQRPDTSSSRNQHELAGGIEDWEDVNGHDVDRYGFINMRPKSLRPGTPEPRPAQRVSTSLALASEEPRKKRVFGRASSAATTKQIPSRKVSARSLNTQASGSSTRSTSRIRAAANRLPGNKDRRWMDEAGDMLTLPPGLADIAEDEEGGRAVETLKRKEWERAEKWRKMAKITMAGKHGEGMQFEFDPKNPKVIERTWKGIPDRWRAAAWHSFLSSSARKVKNSPTDEQLIEAFHKHLLEGSADDMQIDIDVPRTINSHIMFRKRYRGGQRLLFRVLHSLSLYFPNTGYVQGMASLAATLLCYYEEEKCFVMLARMWSLRGLSKLYESGFLGLMAALDEFEKDWLNGNDVSQRLEELGISATAYGTRWYLTLFNYSIPFAAQLRVWDVFMLLGDADPGLKLTDERPFGGELDVLHAAGAALIDGTREILMDSDFENVMKVLTSWIPVKDEELLMKVMKAEWKMHKARGGRH